MRRFWLSAALIFSLCALVFAAVSLPLEGDGPGARQGVLDLGPGALGEEIYALEGAWEIYYGRLLTPADFAGGPPAGGALISLPASWAGPDRPAAGCATYRLVIRTAPGQSLALLIPEIISASKLWVNGAPVFQAGQVGTQAAACVPSLRNEIVRLDSGDGTLELVVQASNFHMVGSGLFYPLLLGRADVLTHRFFAQRLAAAAVLGGILLIGLYHLFLYGFRRGERIYLTFFLLCLTTVLRLCMETNGFAQYLLPGGMTLAVGRAYLLCFLLHGLCLCLFLLQVFSLELRGLVRGVFWVCLAAPLAGVFLLPYYAAVAFAFLAFPALLIPVVLVLRAGKIGRDPYYRLYLCGMVFFLVCAPLTKTVLEGAFFLPAVAPNLFLIFSQCVMLSRDYARARAEAERLNANLEALVAQRTAQLSASQTALQEMIANISHDLKTPLTVLNNYLELLGDDALAMDEQERAEYLGIAYHKNLDLQRLIRNLFEVTRMEGGTAVYRLEPMPAARLMAEAAGKYADQARDKGISFTAHGEEGLTLEIDPDKIWSVLDNLVYNALRHTPRGGAIALSAERRGERAVLRVADTGEGIPPEHLPHIFDRFYKVSPDRGEKDGSSGLGLYIVRTAAEAMGGTAAVESAVGRGTVFTVSFPAP